MSRLRAEGSTDPALIREVLDYDPDTGILTWRARVNGTTGSSGRPSNFNARLAGSRAFTSKDRQGYHRGVIFGRDYKAHRVAWAIHYGEWPAGLIDHANGDPSDNRISNLRCVSASGNMRNRRLNRNNKSGRVGVRQCRVTGNWIAHISVDGEKIHLGHFPSFEAACERRAEAERQHGYHPNHGRK